MAGFLADSPYLLALPVTSGCGSSGDVHSRSMTDYSGGSALDFHQLPFSPQNAVTIKLCIRLTLFEAGRAVKTLRLVLVLPVRENFIHEVLSFFVGHVAPLHDFFGCSKASPAVSGFVIDFTIFVAGADNFFLGHFDFPVLLIIQQHVHGSRKETPLPLTLFQ